MKIEKIEIKNLHHRFNINLNNLSSGLNVVHAENGAGKTTVLHIIANLLNGDLSRFLYLDFDLISVWFSGQADPIRIQSEVTKEGLRILFKLPNDEFYIAKKGAELAELAVRAKKNRKLR